MQAYREVFSGGEQRMVLTPESDFFRYFREMPGVRVPAAAPATPSPAPAPG